jgi:hypothetical protein
VMITINLKVYEHVKNQEYIYIYNGVDLNA